ncbi:MAG: DUF229 domain-containing protein, partial [Pedobacter sp.]
FYSYRLPNFTNHVLEQMEEVRTSAQPVFLFVHTCSMHWPGILPFPYYPRSDFPEHSQVPFSYTSKFRGLSHQPLTSEQWVEQSQFNQRIYDSAKQMTVDEFLNPVFSYLKQSGLMDNSIVVLMSDHGENLWQSGPKYPKEKMVEHGGSLLFGSQSELSFFRIKAPMLTPATSDQTAGVIDILPSVLQLAGLTATDVDGKSFVTEGKLKPQGQSYYVETGLWPFASYSGQFLTTPATNLGPLLKLDSEYWKLFVDPLFLPGVVLQKQRAIYIGDYRYTVFPTSKGFEEFLCDTERDKGCLTNLALELPEVLKQARSQITPYFKADIDHDLLRVGACSSLPSMEPSTAPKFSEVRKYQWQYFFQALECLRSKHDYAYSTAILNSLMNNEEVSAQLKSRILLHGLNLCGWATAFNSINMPDYMRNHLNINEDTDLAQLKYGEATLRCLTILGNHVAAELVSNKLLEKRSKSKTQIESLVQQELSEIRQSRELHNLNEMP